METELTLEADLLEASEKAYHHDIAKYQLHQRERLQEVEDQLALWAHDEIQKGEYDETMTDFVVITHIEKMRSIFQKETQAFIEIMERQKQQRDTAIKLFAARTKAPQPS